jgi:hypothetical protein
VNDEPVVLAASFANRLVDENGVVVVARTRGITPKTVTLSGVLPLFSSSWTRPAGMTND